MNNAPERIWVWPDTDIPWPDTDGEQNLSVYLKGFNGLCHWMPVISTEYVRADTITTLDAERDRLRACGIDMRTLARWSKAMGDWDDGGQECLEEIDHAISARQHAGKNND